MQMMSGLQFLQKAISLPISSTEKDGAGGVALGALDGHQLGFFVDGGPDAVVVKAAVRKQVYLAVADAVFPQGAGGGADADDLLQRVIGRARRGSAVRRPAGGWPPAPVPAHGCRR